jgi:hypothetical protein
MIKSNHDHVCSATQMFDTLFAKYKVAPWILNKKIIFQLFPIHFHLFKILNKARPCCKHMPSKLDDHFVGVFHWQYETIHIINGKKPPLLI